PRDSPLRWPGRFEMLLFICAAIAIAFLYLFDPETSSGFLSCPFRQITGYLCSGCGSQRALHDLLHGRINEAFQHNAALVISFPLLAIQWITSRIVPADRDPIRSNVVVFGWLILIIGWGVFRNLHHFSCSH
ncbi:MAG: DUF2752 domain-containing protein, partial [Bacteroidota bacterium]|nr:DUF2752 domain-containing protein [Bacteroidota bacterium]